MATLVVIVDEVLRDQMAQVLLAEDHKVIQALGLDALYPAFGRSLEVGRYWPHRKHLNTVGFEDCVEIRDELRVVVAEEKARLDRLVGKEHRDIAGLLHHPLPIRMSRQTRHVHLAAVEVDEKEYKDVDQAAHGPDFLGEV